MASVRLPQKAESPSSTASIIKSPVAAPDAKLSSPSASTTVLAPAFPTTNESIHGVEISKTSATLPDAKLTVAGVSLTIAAPIPTAPAPVVEEKEVKPGEKISADVKKLMEVAKSQKLLAHDEVTQLLPEETLALCIRNFASYDHIATGENYFKQYLQLHGKEEPAMPGLASFFRYKTNQTLNRNALLSVGDRSLIRDNLLPQYVFNVICKLHDLQESKSVKAGETLDVIRAIITAYGLPLESAKFNPIRNHFNEALVGLQLHMAQLPHNIPSLRP